MKFELEGYDIDNLLQTLYFKHITLYDIDRPQRNKVRFQVADKDADKVARYVRNFKAQTKYTGIRNFPRLVLANVGILIGIIVGIVVGTVFSRYTWQIEIYGLEELTETEVVAILADYGISTGQINLATSDEISEILISNCDRIAQASVIKKGNAIIINISEKLVYNDTSYEPIVAAYKGIITEIDIITGTTNVKVGDYVNVGDILVLPFNIDSEGNKVSVQPKAIISGTIYITAKCEMRKTDVVLTRTGASCTTYQYKVGGLNLFSVKGKNSFALFEAESYNEYMSDILPLKRLVTVYYELTTQSIEHDFDAERDALIAESKEQAYSLTPDDTYFQTETTETEIVGDTMYAITVLTLYGRLNG